MPGLLNILIEKNMTERAHDESKAEHLRSTNTNGEARGGDGTRYPPGLLHVGRRKPNGLGCDGYEPLGTLERGMERKEELGIGQRCMQKAFEHKNADHDSMRDQRKKKQRKKGDIWIPESKKVKKK